MNKAFFSALFATFALAVFPLDAKAVACADVLATGVETLADSDGDGFTDLQECTGVTTVGQNGLNQVFFPWCGAPGTDGALPRRDRCMDPDSKDLFVILSTATSAPSILPQDFRPYEPVTAYGITFTGLDSLGLAVHQLSPLEAALNREVTSPVAGLITQKAIRVAESLDASGTILGNCQYGSPLGLDGCIVYTQRTKNFVASTCGNTPVFTPGGVQSTQEQVVLAYSTYLILHEAGHSLGGLTGEYNSRFGGYHYKPGAGLVMEQAVTYTVKGGKCTFYISPNWNPTLDPQAVRLR